MIKMSWEYILKAPVEKEWVKDIVFGRYGLKNNLQDDVKLQWLESDDVTAKFTMQLDRDVAYFGVPRQELAELNKRNRDADKAYREYRGKKTYQELVDEAGGKEQHKQKIKELGGTYPEIFEGLPNLKKIYEEQGNKSWDERNKGPATTNKTGKFGFNAEVEIKLMSLLGKPSIEARGKGGRQKPNVDWTKYIKVKAKNYYPDDFHITPEVASYLNDFLHSYKTFDYDDMLIFTKKAMPDLEGDLPNLIGIGKPTQVKTGKQFPAYKKYMNFSDEMENYIVGFFQSYFAGNFDWDWEGQLAQNPENEWADKQIEEFYEAKRKRR